MPAWLKDAVFYEIYPQSFKDTNSDGIGDLEGIIEKLDYVKSLGCNALWLNPVYDSPFKDAGYDVRDYKKVAPRYGTNEDLVRLFEEAHKKGIKVLLDLVPGHTSEEHEWFKKSCEADRNEFSDRYIWTNGAFCGIGGHPYIGGEAERDGCYMLNFFKCQPALNYGVLNKTEEWQTPCDSEAAIDTREAMKDVMRFWLDKGCDGFRVDMADSLVKEDDDKKSATGRIWTNIREMLDKDYPEAALVSEWCNPECALKYGFHADFYLDHHGNGYNVLFRDNETEGPDNSYFNKNCDEDPMRFLDDYLGRYNNSKEYGYISFITCNHDTPRCTKTMTPDELKIAYSFIFTMPGVPFLYYGDEIGMKYLDYVRTKEGGFQRTGSRSPMQWDKSLDNFGFSDAPFDKLYIPVDKDENAPSVKTCEEDENSLIHTVRDIIALRHKYEDLQADAEFKVVYAKKGERIFVYKRGDLLIAVNPGLKEVSAEIPAQDLKTNLIFKLGSADISSGNICLGAQSFAIWQ
ncbi:alpha-amylase family glycosyl hydrolase [Butyrivibrio sp. NC2002]|uniref:alpha-amylase family glycosyl hydrolase n=1 Tax=Butyrivibrio sp. NC2002 TaxID=1410610 RepID=UPI00056204BE|nr:alpha-amylase family glycosyl hydrolase [Butyrivibrio sp. NC2002]